MAHPVSAISCVSNIFIKQMTFPKAGDCETGHAHVFDHLTLLASGKIKLTALGKPTEFIAPQHIFIKAGVVHEITALEDNTVVHCIHALRDGERVEDIVDPASVPVHVEMQDVDERKFYPMTQDHLDAIRAS